MITTLKEFGRGQITLPKRWRDRFQADNYIAKETSLGLLIIPLTDSVVSIDERKLRKESETVAPKAVFKSKAISKKKRK